MSSPNATTTATSNDAKRQQLAPGTNKSKRILVTGGAGYIGSHTLLVLLAAGYDCVVVDNLDNGDWTSLDRVRELSGLEPASPRLAAVEVDLVDLAELRRAVSEHGPFAGCIHFAGFKAVGESAEIPLHYYFNNVVGTLNLLVVLRECGVQSLVFSSSCTVYGATAPDRMPLVESEPTGAVSAYGRTKVHIEDILRDVCAVTPGKHNMSCIMLRYFNPVGAHPSGRMGEDPKGVPNNLLPYVAQVAVGRRAFVSVYGNDYPTPDGTGVRDYIHVMDLARAHLCALRRLETATTPLGAAVYNVGTGKGSSVLDVIRAFEKACGKEIPYRVVPRRAGDVAVAYCDPAAAERDLGFKCELTLDDACRDMWRWQTSNPHGYGVAEAAEGASSAAQTRRAKVFSLLASASASR